MIVGLDIGTSCIRVVIGENDENGELKIAGTASEKSVGLRNGNIVNIEAASGAIRRAIENAEQNAGMEIRSCYAAIGGEQIEGLNASGKVAVSSKGRYQREIAESDIERVRESATAVQLSLDREILHVITQDYIVDHVSGIKDPMHRLGVCLEAKVHIITASGTTIQNVNACINRAGLSIERIMLKTVAVTKAVATAEEEELGSIIIDLGAGSTDILVLLHGAPICTASIPVGGNVVTSDIAIVKGISTAEAERIKLEAGACWGGAVQQGRKVIIGGVGGGRPPEEIEQQELCGIIAPRMEEIFLMVSRKIVEKTSVTQLSGNIILTGGGANMPGVIEIAQYVFRTRSVRIGKPGRLGGIVEDYEGPEWATAVGLVLAFKNEAERAASGRFRRRSSLAKAGDDNALKKFFRSLF